MENILILCAHPDDEIFGVGGTIAKYTKEGKEVHSVIFSYGEKAMPWLKESEVRKIREKECLSAAKIIGTKETIFLGLEEGKIQQASKEKITKIKKLIQNLSPSMIFTHSIDDPHFDHRAVHNLVKVALQEVNYSGDVYAFDIWNPLIFHKRNSPRLYVDISKTFHLKLRALKHFKTQKIQGRWPLTPAVLFRAVMYGLQSHAKYSERFLKIDISKDQ